MSDLRIGVTLYNLRDFCQTAEELADTLRKVKKIGYDVIQVSGIGPIDPQEVAKMVEGEGLSVCCTHTPFERITGDLAAVIEEHKLWNCPYVGLGALPADMRTPEGYVKWARQGSEIGAQLKEAGLGLIYHNHSFEFEKHGDRTGLAILYEDSDPDTFLAEIDTYWVQHGGGDPAAWVRKVAGRIPVVHCKDMGRLDGEQVFLEVGEGNLNWPAIWEASRDAGAQYCVFEQDISQRDPFESAAISFKNMKAMGLST